VVKKAPKLTFKITLTRDVIELEDQAAKMTSIDVPHGENHKTFSVISIPSFYSNQGRATEKAKYTATTHDVRLLIEEMQKEGKSDGLVIDLRGNGGGFLNEAIGLTGLFIEKGPVVQVIPSNRKTEVLKDRDSSVAYDGPLVVLIDRYSASASETLRGHFQKDSSSHNSQVKFTNAQFFRVNGGSTQHKGVTPDIILNSGAEDTEFGERAYDNALPWSETKSAKYTSKNISSSMVKSLTEDHVERSNQSPAFTFLRQNSERVAKNKDIKSLSLNLKDRQAERDRLENESLSQLNTYRKALGLEAVTSETRKDNPLPDEDEHWNKVYQQEAANILHDLINWSSAVLSNVEHKNKAEDKN